MSSTKRGATRAADDGYMTPGWVTKAVLPHLGPLAGKRILEPQGGRGSIVRELLAAGADPALVTVVEVNEVHAEVMRREWGASGMRIICDDFLRVTPLSLYADAAVAAFDLIVKNPPFETAQAHIEHAIQFLAPRGICAALLRLAFCVGSRRRKFREQYPCNLFPLATRPSFTAESLAWLTDEELLAMARPVKATKQEPAHIESIDEVRVRLRGSDSADYAWQTYCRDPGPFNYGGRFAVLEGQTAAERRGGAPRARATRRRKA